MLIGLRDDKTSSLLYPILLFVRRYLFALVVVLATELIFVQIWAMYLTCFVQAIYLLHVRPFVQPSMLNQLEVFNEVCSMLLLYSLMSFSDANLFFKSSEQQPSVEQEDSGGELAFDWIFFSVVSLNLLTQLTLLLISSLVCLKRLCRRKKKNRVHQSATPISRNSDQAVALDDDLVSEQQQRHQHQQRNAQVALELAMIPEV